MKQRMRIPALLLALVLCLSLLPVPAFAAPVTFAAAFPSENFRQQLNEAVLTPAGLTAEDETELTDAHLAALRAVTSLSLQDIEDYTGLELLTGLTELKLRQKATLIEWLDLRANTKLQKLDFRGCWLRGLDVTGLTELRELDCGDTSISRLNLSTNTKLEKLVCYATGLSELVLQDKGALRYLTCGMTQIKNLDLRGCPALEELDCNWGKLETLDVSGCPALRKINCNLNKLRTLDLSQNTALEDVTLGDQSTRSDAPMTPYPDGTYRYNMALLEPTFDFSRISADTGASFDASTGVMTLQNRRSSFQYFYDTKAPKDSKMTVTVSVPESEEDTRPNPFADVAATQYYYQPVLWAYYHNVVAGTSATTFSPDAPCTRAQIVTFLWRAAGKPTVSGSTPFVDVDRNAYYAQAVAWAVDQGITAGTTATTFSPNAPCTRAQSVCFLWRYFGSPPGLMLDTFDDVPADAYYTRAVAWATMNRITSGIGDGLFAPDGTCTRAQIVSFLYRAQV